MFWRIGTSQQDAFILLGNLQRPQPRSSQIGGLVREFHTKMSVVQVNWVLVSDILNFQPYLGKIPILTNIFQRGWFNHQLLKDLQEIAQESFLITFCRIIFFHPKNQKKANTGGATFADGIGSSVCNWQSFWRWFEGGLRSKGSNKWDLRIHPRKLT